MFSSKLFFTALAAAALTCSVASAATVLDQSAPPLGGRFNESLEWQQEVTAEVSGLLAGITLYGNETNVLVRIAEGDGFYSGPYAFSQVAHLSDGGTFIDTLAANIFLSAGQHFVIDTSQGSGGNLSMAAAQYAGGDLFLNFNGPENYTSELGDSLAFRTFMAVPEPTTWALLLTGFAGVGLALRRRRVLVLAA